MKNIHHCWQTLNVRRTRPQTFLSLLLRPPLSAGLIAAGLLAASDGCSILKPGKSESHYYVLTPSRQSIGSLSSADESTNGCVVCLAPVEVASYLQGKDMAVREGSHEVRFDLFHRWAEPLDAGIRRVLAEDLRSAPGIRAVVTDQSAPTGAVIYNISIHVLACEGMLTNQHGSTIFQATWEIAGSGASANLHLQGVFEAPQRTWAPGNYDDLADQLSGALGDLSRSLAIAIPGKPVNPSSQ